MLDAMIHRGPDDSGRTLDGSVAIGMRRLSIIDLDGGHQPIASEDGSVQVVCNGEIYNYRELRRDLRAQGHRFRTGSDVEVIVHLYEERGAELLDVLRGMFALALWDSANRQLLLAVDGFGIKPLYYSDNSNGLVFASELDSLMSSGLVSGVADRQALGHYFDFGYIPAPQTAYAGVRKLQPGHCLTWAHERPHVERCYWDLRVPQAVYDGGQRELRSELRERLRDAVRAHMISDVPVGVLLSGGVDSSSVAALMREVDAGSLRTFTVGFPGDPDDERSVARRTAQKLGADHTELTVTPADTEILPQLAKHFGEPFGDASALPTFLVSQQAREHVKVVLSGDGGDELFVGYTAFRGLELANLVSRLPRGLRELAIRMASSPPVVGDVRANDWIQRTARRMRGSLRDPVEAYRQKVRPYGLDDPAALLSAEFTDVLHTSGRTDPLMDALAAFRTMREPAFLEPFLYAGLKLGLAGDMLVKVDRMSMASSLEVRVPLLDRGLAEFLVSVPMQRRLPHHRLKGLLKDAMRDALLPEVIRGPKRGFGPPLKQWFRGDLMGFFTDVLLDRESGQAGVLNRDAVHGLIEEHRSGRTHAGGALWTLLMFELWRRECAVEPIL